MYNYEKNYGRTTPRNDKKYKYCKENKMEVRKSIRKDHRKLFEKKISEVVERYKKMKVFIEKQ